MILTQVSVQDQTAEAPRKAGTPEMTIVVRGSFGLSRPSRSTTAAGPQSTDSSKADAACASPVPNADGRYRGAGSRDGSGGENRLKVRGVWSPGHLLQGGATSFVLAIQKKKPIVIPSRCRPSPVRAHQREDSSCRNCLRGTRTRTSRHRSSVWPRNTVAGQTSAARTAWGDPEGRRE